VVACEGQTALAVGRVADLTNSTEILASLTSGRLSGCCLIRGVCPISTTVYELGRSPANLLELEQRLHRRQPAAVSILRPVVPKAEPVPAALPPLDQFSARIVGIWWLHPASTVPCYCSSKTNLCSATRCACHPQCHVLCRSPDCARRYASLLDHPAIFPATQFTTQR
jgi:hypothetical protein